MHPARTRAALGQLSLDLSPFVGFAVSFFVIGRFWWSHHQTFAPVQRWSPALVRLTCAGLFTVVLLPAATAFSFEYDATTSPIPAVDFWALLLSAVIGPFELLVRRVYRRRDRTLGSLSDRDARLVLSSEAQSPATARAAPTPRE